MNIRPLRGCCLFSLGVFFAKNRNFSRAAAPPARMTRPKGRALVLSVCGLPLARRIPTVLSLRMKTDGVSRERGVDVFCRWSECAHLRYYTAGEAFHRA